jgi:uridine kinase
MARWVPARADVIAEYAQEVLGLFPRGRILVGVDGLDGAGKTTFASDLATAIGETGVSAAAVSLDAFHTERAMRHRPPDDARTWYEHAYDYEAFRERTVVPFRRGEPVALEHRSRVEDRVLDDPPTFQPEERAVLVVEGVFALRPELRGIWHTSALLDVPIDLAFARCVDRDGWDPAEDAILNRTFFGAERIYLHEVHPRRVANASFDVTDVAHPRRVFADAC